MTRIIAGVAGGRRIAVPPKGTRPTSDRVREAMFSSLDARLDWSEVTVLDLYAGSGALGLEARSRGAREVILVERGPAACRVISGNITHLGLGHVRLLQADVESLVSRAAVACELVLVDPPYDDPAAHVVSLLKSLHEAGWIAQDADVVVERRARDADSPLPEGWFTSRKAYGETCLWYGQAQRG